MDVRVLHKLLVTLADVAALINPTSQWEFTKATSYRLMHLSFQLANGIFLHSNDV